MRRNLFVYLIASNRIAGVIEFESFVFQNENKSRMNERTLSVMFFGIKLPDFNHLTTT